MPSDFNNEVNTSKRRAVTAPSPLEVRMEELARSLGLAPGASSSAPPSDDPARVRVPRPTPREARDILRQLGVPCASETEIAWVSTPAPYRRGRLRLAVLTRHLLVYARGLDPLQAAYERALQSTGGSGGWGGCRWDLDWTGAVENLAWANEAYSTEDDDVRRGADDDGNGNGGTTWHSFTAAVDRYVRSFTAETSSSTVGSSSTGPDRRAALVSVHFRPRDAWLGDPDATKRRHVAVSPDEVPSFLAHLARAMRAAGRTPALAWAERPGKTTTIVYLKGPPLGEVGNDARTRSLVQFVSRVCADHGLAPSPSADRRSIVARTPAGARTQMETRLTLGRHAVKGDALVMEHRRWETEEVAKDAAKAAGAVGLMAAFGAFGVIAVAALNATSAASPVVRYGAPPVRRVPVRRPGRSMMGRPAIWSWRWDFDFNRAGRTGSTGDASMATHAAAADDDGTFNVPGSNPRVVRADDPSLGFGVRARDKFHAIFSRNLRSAMANAGFVDQPKCPAQFALAREPRGDLNVPGSNPHGSDDGVDDGWTLVLTPETAWADAEEARAESAEPSIGDLNVQGSNPRGGTSAPPSAPPLPREPTPTDADVLDARDRRRTGETNGNDRKRPDSFAGKNVPKHFSCPITHELFVDPVIFADGHTYERDAIARWLRDHRETSPMTGASFPGRQIVLLPNHAMRSQVEEWKANNIVDGEPRSECG